jgi:hypothetical protein
MYEHQLLGWLFAFGVSIICARGYVLVVLLSHDFQALILTYLRLKAVAGQYY